MDGPASEEAVAEGRIILGGRGAASLKTCFGSRNLGSICFGAMKPWQTTKISAETFLLISLGFR